jgi:uncharacterized protein YndB with AHSA1/START domain
MQIEDVTVIDAPADDVWQAIEDPARHAAWHPFVTAIAGEHRLGASRTCSVLVGNKEGETTEQCVQCDALRRITWTIEHDTTGFSRMVSDWQAGFRLETRDGSTVVTAESTFAANSVLVRVMAPLIRRRFHQTQKAILAALKRSVETTG